MKDGFGTSDAIVIHEGGDKGIVSVVDLKFGTGVRVDAKDNSQAMLYALGVLNEHGGDLFKLVIVQPRLQHISEWEITRRDLLSWAETVVKPKAKLALTDNPPLNPSEIACRFCKAKHHCRALAEYNYNLAVEAFSHFGAPAVLKKPEKISASELATILPNISLFRKWLNAIEAHAISQLSNGVSINGIKLVAGRSNRVWRDNLVAEQALLSTRLTETDIYPKKLISPAQAKKLLGKNIQQLETLIFKPQGNPTLAPLDDYREPINVEIQQEFNNAL